MSPTSHASHVPMTCASPFLTSSRPAADRVDLSFGADDPHPLLSPASCCYQIMGTRERRRRGRTAGRPILLGMRLPSDPEIRALHERHSPAPAALDLVYTHCEIVTGVAGQLLARGARRLDAGLARAGSLLHDIGVYRLCGPDGSDGQLDQASYLRHGIL